jgi:hypothetical protein
MWHVTLCVKTHKHGEGKRKLMIYLANLSKVETFTIEIMHSNAS